ncbi:MAG TPA: hypothetical protein VLM75_11625 [Spirochaetota bacterium]|nr:hypothetical protein [Spirochaetota bacterium]
MPVSEDVWKFMKDHLEYDDQEMEKFRGNPANEDILSKGRELMNKTLVFEVVESKGCNSKHKVGDKFYFDGAGNLLTGKSPKRCCIYALQVMVPAIFASNELIYAGIDANSMRFKSASCFDVGVKCCGWGQITVRFSAEEKM